jgi:site-specific DNA recombinase
VEILVDFPSKYRIIQLFATKGGVTFRIATKGATLDRPRRPLTFIRSSRKVRSSKMVKQTETNNSNLRAVGYSRTSGEGQRDNTSIPRQKSDIEQYAFTNGWKFVKHYIDECQSGAKIEGRDSFKQMIRDAANGQFDIICVYDITRFSRDGGDIIGESRILKRTFNIDVVDTKGYDTRDHRNILMNFVKAGVSEAERLTIMERAIGGRIENAKDGLPWTSKTSWPAGRSFNKENGQWYITEEGKKLHKLLQRYANGEPLKDLAKEYGFLCSATINRNIHKSQLSGIYHAKFNAPAIGICNRQIPVPAIPQIITPELEKRVKTRLSYNRQWNKQGKRKYLLTGFVKCSQCGRALIAQKVGNHIYYNHYKNYTHSSKGCSYNSIRADMLEPAVLNYLYEFFLDEPSYTEAIKRALPSDDDRKMLNKDIKAVERQLANIDKEISNLVNAVAKGADLDLFLDKQKELKNEKRLLENRRDELTQTLATMPDPEAIANEAMSLRLALIKKYKDRDWRSLPYEEVRRFLHFLFGDNPIPRGQGKDTGYGISVVRKNDEWHITFKGLVEFYHDVIDGRPLSHAFLAVSDMASASLINDVKERIKEADEALKQRCGENKKTYNQIKAKSQAWFKRLCKESSEDKKKHLKQACDESQKAFKRLSKESERTVKVLEPFNDN